MDAETATSHLITVRATSDDASFSTKNFTINVTDDHVDRILAAFGYVQAQHGPAAAFMKNKILTQTVRPQMIINITAGLQLIIIILTIISLIPVGLTVFSAVKCDVSH